MSVVFDSDTHISPGGPIEGIGKFSLEDHIDKMDAAGIDKSLCWLSPHHYTEKKGVEEGNRYVYYAAKKYPDRILGFGWADPTFGLEEAKDRATQCMEEFGFPGVKMNGAQNNYYIDDPKAGFPLAEHIAGLGGMIAFHIGPDAYERTHPLRAEKIAKQFPEIKILMVHMGMTDGGMTGSVIRSALECPNMYLVGSATGEKQILKALSALGAERILFGTDYPFRKMTVIKSMYELGIGPEIPEQDFDLLMGENVVKLFKM